MGYPDTKTGPQVRVIGSAAAALIDSQPRQPGSPPFADADRYVRNSPALAAGRISAPVLLFTADRDYVPPGQAEELFSALYRQQKDVVLVTYRGEGHVLSSPANIRDFYDTAWAWLDEVLQPPRSKQNALAPAALASKMD